MADFPTIDFTQFQWEVLDQNYLTKHNAQQVAMVTFQNNIAAFGAAVEQEQADTISTVETIRDDEVIPARNTAVQAATTAVEYRDETQQLRDEAEQIVTGDTPITSLKPGTLTNPQDYVSTDGAGNLVKRNLATDVASTEITALKATGGTTSQVIGPDGEGGVRLKSLPQELSIGQIVLAPENDDAPGWLKLDNSTVLRSAYPQLASYADRVLATELLVYEFSYPSLPTTSALSGVAYGNGIYIATGQTVLTSTDGVNWVDQGALIPYSPRIAFGNGLFVAVGSSGNIHTTTDGVNWTQQVSGTAESISTVTYINSMFVACGSGLLMSSTDGVVWAIKTTPFTASPPGIAFGNGVYVLCFPIAGGEVEIWSSSDLENWTLGFQGDFDITLRGINYINGWFYLLGGRRSYSYAKIIRFQSPSGPWDDITPAQAGQNTSLYIVTEQAGDTLLAFGDNRAVARSDDDGETWQLVSAVGGSSFRSGVSVNGSVTVVGQSGTSILNYAPGDTLKLTSADTVYPAYIKAEG